MGNTFDLHLSCFPTCAFADPKGCIGFVSYRSQLILSSQPLPKVSPHFNCSVEENSYLMFLFSSERYSISTVLFR